MQDTCWQWGHLRKEGGGCLGSESACRHLWNITEFGCPEHQEVYVISTQITLRIRTFRYEYAHVIYLHSFLYSLWPCAMMKSVD